MEKRTKNETIRRYFVLIISQFFIGTGVAFTRRPGLGITPISSVAHVVSLWRPEYSFGTWLALWNFIMFLMQIVILRKDFKKEQFLQVPLTMISGVFADAGTMIASRFPIDNYPYMLMCIVLGSMILATGISISVVCNVVLSPGEGIIQAISQKFKIRFGSVKLCFDISCVAISIILSLVLFNMKLVGIREGSVIAALLTGNFVKLIMPLIKDDLTNWFIAAN